MSIHNLCFLSRNNKNNYKWGLRESKLYKPVFVMPVPMAVALEIDFCCCCCSYFFFFFLQS